jgi:dTDP-4-amino-4,6-dideoxygalactose transaminase
VIEIPLIRPDLAYGEVADDLEAVIESGWLASGPRVAAFEAAVAERVGVRHCFATTSATTALHLALAAAGIGPGDEVLVADFTFPATANVVIQLGAVPVLVDCSADDFAVDPAALRAAVTDRTRAVMPVDPFGQPADMPAIESLANEDDLVVVEDAACALGAELDGRACGAFPDLGCFSFHPRKVVTTGEGGAVTTSDPELAERVRLLRNHGMRRDDQGLAFVEPGFNYRMSELQAVLGMAQIRRLDAILDDRARTCTLYDEQLGDVHGVEVRRPSTGRKWTYQSYVVMLEDGIDRDAVIARMADQGVETTLGTYALHAQPAYARLGYTPGDLPHSYRAQRQSLTLPVLPSMKPELVDRVVEALRASVG